MCVLSGGRSLSAPQIPAGRWRPRAPAPGSARSELSGMRGCPGEALSPLLVHRLSARTSQGSSSPGLSSSLVERWRLSWDPRLAPRAWSPIQPSGRMGRCWPWPPGQGVWVVGRPEQPTGQEEGPCGARGPCVFMSPRHRSRALPDWKLRPRGPASRPHSPPVEG